MAGGVAAHDDGLPPHLYYVMDLRSGRPANVPDPAWSYKHGESDEEVKLDILANKPLLPIETVLPVPNDVGAVVTPN